VSLQSRISDLITAVGADINALYARAIWEKSWTFPGSLSLYVGQTRIYNTTGRTLTIQGIWISAGTAPTGSSILVDINKNGTTIFTTQGNRPAIAVSAFASSVVSNMNITSLADGDYMTIDIDQIGSTIAGSDLSVQVWAK
jgi:hypothetical protein